MTTTELTTLIDQLERGIHPTTHRPFDLTTSALSRPRVGQALRNLRLILDEVTSASAHTNATPDEATLRRAAEELRAVGYEPRTELVSKVLRGGRSLADPTLRGLETYAHYRGKLGKRELTRGVEIFARAHPTVIIPASPGRATPAGEPKNAAVAHPVKTPDGEGSVVKLRPQPTQDEGWRAVTFFSDPPFDALEATKARELTRAVTQLGLRKPTENLPEYMARARRRYSRSYEPWTREEKALLVEAMCYTNQADKLEAVFGRSANSLETTGKKLIYDSQRSATKAG